MSDRAGGKLFPTQKFLIEPNISIRQALHAMAEIGGKCLIVVDPGERVVGTLSDGDLRRAILNNQDLSESIKEVFHKESTILEKGKYTRIEVEHLFSENRLELIPVVDRSGKVIDVLTWDSFLKPNWKENKRRVETPVIIMAGGRGTRLEPFTKVLPKPLLPIHDKPIIEHIIEKFLSAGINDYYLTVNHMSRILKAYFEELRPSYSIHFIEESEPLGTAGSLKYLEGKFDQPFIVTNCDVIFEIDYADLILFHKERKNDLTLVVCEKEYTIPYGTCKLNKEGNLDHIEEKPEYHFLVNAGLYVVNPLLLDLIPKGKFYHITNLIADATQADLCVGAYPISQESWIDVGQWPEYQKAVDMFVP